MKGQGQDRNKGLQLKPYSKGTSWKSSSQRGLGAWWELPAQENKEGQERERNTTGNHDLKIRE